MIKLLMALSDAGKGEERKCVAPAGFSNNTEEWSANYITQLEPTALFLMDNYDEQVEIILLCTPQTLESKENEPSTFEKFKTNISRRAEDKGKNIKIKKIDLDINDDNEAIEQVVEDLRNSRSYSLWIDIHGGPREIAFTLNTIISLLKVYGIKVDRLVTVNAPREADHSDLKDASSTFKMLEFASGMNEFINFGIVKTLMEFIEKEDEYGDKELINAIKMVSDGTVLCDPDKYETGLDELKRVMDNRTEWRGLLSIFRDYIETDFGRLLDMDQRTPLDIVKRCNKKGQIQQALTYIESSMPKMFVEKGVLYFDKQKEETVKKLQKNMKMEREKTSNFLINQYIFPLKDIYTDCKKNSNPDELAVDTLRNGLNCLKDGFLNKETIPVIKNEKGKGKGKVGEIEVLSNLKDEYKSEAGKIMRLHWVLKRCRNMINHASEDKGANRPTLSEIEKGIAMYIELADKVFADDSFVESGQQPQPQGLTKICTPPANSKNPQKDNLAELTVTEFKFAKGNWRLVGTLGKKGNGFVILKDKDEDEDLSGYVGQTINVKIINEHKNNGENAPKECSMIG